MPTSKITDIDARDSLAASLRELGLSAKESSVYLSLLSSGEVGTTAIVRDTGLHRQFVYDTLASLEEKGLVGHSIARGRKKFYSHSPSKLAGLFEHKKRIADALVKKMEKSFLTSDIQEVESYKGTEAFAANEFEILKAQPQGSKIYIFGGNGDDYVEKLGAYYQEYEYQRTKKKIEVLYLGNQHLKEMLTDSRNERDMFHYRMLPAGLSGDLNTCVYHDRICFYMFGEPIAVFSIKSEKIARSYADFFMGLWKMSR